MNITPKISIIPFDPKYAKDFANLNIEWIEKYFFIEPEDIKLLNECEESIINNGGFIFFAKVDSTIAGTFALIKVSEGIFELGKMAVSPMFQGNKIGQKLIEFCLDFAEIKKWKKVILYSNKKLENAIHIYHKYGFKEIELEKDVIYQRSNYKMELILK